MAVRTRRSVKRSNASRCKLEDDDSSEHFPQCASTAERTEQTPLWPTFEIAVAHPPFPSAVIGSQAWYGADPVGRAQHPYDRRATIAGPLDLGQFVAPAPARQYYDASGHPSTEPSSQPTPSTSKLQPLAVRQPPDGADAFDDSQTINLASQVKLEDCTDGSLANDNEAAAKAEALRSAIASVSDIEAHPYRDDKGEEIWPCPFCDKEYGGKHGRSIWRRHLCNKHDIPLNVQPRRTRWDNDANRPKDEAERHKRTLESKRRWAAKNRAEKRARRNRDPDGSRSVSVDVSVDGDPPAAGPYDAHLARLLAEKASARELQERSAQQHPHQGGHPSQSDHFTRSGPAPLTYVPPPLLTTHANGKDFVNAVNLNVNPNFIPYERIAAPKSKHTAPDHAEQAPGIAHYMSAAPPRMPMAGNVVNLLPCHYADHTEFLANFPGETTLGLRETTLVPNKGVIKQRSQQYPDSFAAYHAMASLPHPGLHGRSAITARSEEGVAESANLTAGGRGNLDPVERNLAPVERNFAPNPHAPAVQPEFGRTSIRHRQPSSLLPALSPIPGRRQAGMLEGSERPANELKTSAEPERPAVEPRAKRLRRTDTKAEAALQLLALKTSSSSPPGSPVQDDFSGVLRDFNFDDSGYGEADHLASRRKNLEGSKVLGSPVRHLSLSPTSSPPSALKEAPTQMLSLAATPSRSKRFAQPLINNEYDHVLGDRKGERISLESSPGALGPPLSKRRLLDSSPVMSPLFGQRKQKEEVSRPPPSQANTGHPSSSTATLSSLATPRYGFRHRPASASIFKIDQALSRPSASLLSSPGNILLSSPEHAAISKSLGLVAESGHYSAFDLSFLDNYEGGASEYAAGVFGGSSSFDS